MASGGDGFGDAEVGDDRGAAGEENVLRFDVAVDDAFGVRGGERARDVAHDGDDFGDGERAARFMCSRSDSPWTNGMV